MRTVVQFEYMFPRLGWLARNRDLLAPGDLLNCMSETSETQMCFVYDDPTKEGIRKYHVSDSNYVDSRSLAVEFKLLIEVVPWKEERLVVATLVHLISFRRLPISRI
jgi:hypothetical protein